MPLIVVYSVLNVYKPWQILLKTVATDLRTKRQLSLSSCWWIVSDARFVKQLLIELLVFKDWERCSWFMHHRLLSTSKLHTDDQVFTCFSLSPSITLSSLLWSNHDMVFLGSSTEQQQKERQITLRILPNDLIRFTTCNDREVEEALRFFAWEYDHVRPRNREWLIVLVGPIASWYGWRAIGSASLSPFFLAIICHACIILFLRAPSPLQPSQASAQMDLQQTVLESWWHTP